MYDYLIVGAGLFGAVFARSLTDAGYSCLIIDRRSHIAGNIYTEKQEGIQVHKYGAHIFHTNDPVVWNYITGFMQMNRYTNSPIANYKGEIYNLPFNMNTFNKMWGVVTPAQAAARIEEQRIEALSSLAGVTGQDDPQTKADKLASFKPSNLEEQAISLVGTDIYEKLIKGYTGKQWGRSCTELPSFIIKRLPVRFTYDNNYFNALYQGIPVGGYTQLVQNIIGDIPIRLEVDYLEEKKSVQSFGKPDRLLDEYHAKGWSSKVSDPCSPQVPAGLGIARKVVFTGPVDQYFAYQLGALEYRAVRFETELLDMENYQGNAVVNYTDAETPYTRIIEHKFFTFGKDEQGNDLPKTIISREYSADWKIGDEPYYPVNDERNSSLYRRYKELADAEQDVIFGGRLGEYKYYDMDQVVKAALDKAQAEIEVSACRQ